MQKNQTNNKMSVANVVFSHWNFGSSLSDVWHMRRLESFSAVCLWRSRKAKTVCETKTVRLRWMWQTPHSPTSCTSVPEALRLTLPPYLPHVVSVNVAISHAALQTDPSFSFILYVWLPVRLCNTWNLIITTKDIKEDLQRLTIVVKYRAP